MCGGRSPPRLVTACRYAALQCRRRHTTRGTRKTHKQVEEIQMQSSRNSARSAAAVRRPGSQLPTVMRPAMEWRHLNWRSVAGTAAAPFHRVSCAESAPRAASDPVPGLPEPAALQGVQPSTCRLGVNDGVPPSANNETHGEEVRTGVPEVGVACGGNVDAGVGINDHLRRNGNTILNFCSYATVLRLVSRLIATCAVAVGQLRCHFAVQCRRHVPKEGLCVAAMLRLMTKLMAACTAAKMRPFK